jgi:phage gp29-like protein
MATRNPTFLRNAAALDKYLERYNPLSGLTMTKLSRFFDEGDQGQFAQLMWLCRKVERRDETMRACKRRMGNELARMTWSIKTPSELPPGATELQAQDQAKFLRARYEAVENLKEAVQHLALAEVRGFAHLEKNYDADGTVNKLNCVPQWHWQRDCIYGEWKFSASARPYDKDAKPILEDDRPHWIIREVEDAWLDIALICALRKNLARRDVDGFCARYGIPNTFFIAPVGADATKLAEFAEIADDLVSDGGGALPAGSDVKSVDGGTNKGEIFQQVIDDQNSALVLAATGGLLTMLTAPGSGTLAGSAHQEAWENIVGGVGKAISETLQEQFDAIELKLKFPNQPVLAYFELSYPDQDESRKDLVEDVTKLATAGWRVTKEVLEEKTALTFEEDAGPAPGPQQPPEKGRKPPIKNRFTGGPSSARDRAEAVQLTETAIAEILDTNADILSPLQPELMKLIDLAGSEKASLADFEKLAAQIEALLPELVGADDVAALAAGIEKALGSAAAMGSRAAIRKRKKA